VNNGFDSPPININGYGGFGPSFQCQLVSIRTANFAVKNQWVLVGLVNTEKLQVVNALGLIDAIPVSLVKLVWTLVSPEVREQSVGKTWFRCRSSN
jgi:hypothetical protein